MRYQKSECVRGWLHDFRHVQVLPRGVVERCLKCKLQVFFPHNVPNHIYLSYHLRSALQPYDPRYQHEYQRQNP